MGVAAVETPPAAVGLAGAVVGALDTGVLVLSAGGDLVLANDAAQALGAVRGDRVPVPELLAAAARCRAGDQVPDAEVTLPPAVQAPLRRPRRDQEDTVVRLRVRLLDAEGSVLLLLDDLSEQRRVDAVRRDFVANVSHELKTPVGALHLLAEAICDASDDEVTVRRFAARMTTESQRLSDLVQELIDLSRLQGAEPMREHGEVGLAGLVAEGIDRSRLAADRKGITIDVRGDLELRVPGDTRQIGMAVGNLIDNAVTYSPERTRVVVTLAAAVEGGVAVAHLSVRDEGMGIPLRDRERIFERFFRVDAARSRATGGTGLGLAIVKHVATNHGGAVRVWSAEGAGSTFTLSLPRTPAPSGPPVLRAVPAAMGPV